MTMTSPHRSQPAAVDVTVAPATPATQDAPELPDGVVAGQFATLTTTPADSDTERPTRGDPYWLNSYRRHLILTDLVIIVAVVFTSQALRLNPNARVTIDAVGSVNYWNISAVLSAIWLAALGINGAWDRKGIGTGPGEYGRILQASLYLFGLVGMISYVANAEIPRSYLAIALPLGLFGLCGAHWVWRHLLEEYRCAGSHLRSVLVVGGTNSAAALAANLRNTPGAGFRVAGLCVPGEPSTWTGPHSAVIDGFPIVGDLNDVAATIARCGVDLVAVAASESFGSEQIRRMAWKLEGSGVAIALVPALTDVAGPRIHARPVAGLPLVYVEAPKFKGPKLIAKTTMDLFSAALGLLLLSPLLLVVSLLIKIDDPGPVFFRQERIGLGGQSFRMWKFRSMTQDADTKITEARQKAGQQSSVFYKSTSDARITRVGRFIRKTSIDELPQLFNVLTRQMSIVGPRPLVPGEGAEVGHFLERRMLVRPGITGLWQVSGRSDVTAEERIRMDFYYVENWSLLGDAVITARTVRTVLSRRGAY